MSFFLLVCNEFYNSSGTIKSPNYGYPGKYPNNADICYLIKSTGNIVLRFEYFSLEKESHCEHDYLVLFDGYVFNLGQTLGPINGLCGNNVAPYRLKSSGNTVLMFFHSNNNVTSYGFNIFYFTPKGKFCI